METVVTYLIVGASSVISYLLAHKHIFPLIISWWKEHNDNKLKYKSDLQAVEEVSNNIYANQIKFLNEQIDSLQDIISSKSEELKKLYDELSRMRIRVKNIELELISTKEDSVVYLQNCCSKKDCPMRVSCSDADKLIDKYIGAYETEGEGKI